MSVPLGQVQRSRDVPSNRLIIIFLSVNIAPSGFSSYFTKSTTPLGSFDGQAGGDGNKDMEVPR